MRSMVSNQCLLKITVLLFDFILQIHGLENYWIFVCLFDTIFHVLQGNRNVITVDGINLNYNRSKTPDKLSDYSQDWFVCLTLRKLYSGVALLIFDFLENTCLNNIKGKHCFENTIATSNSKYCKLQDVSVNVSNWVTLGQELHS